MKLPEKQGNIRVSGRIYLRRIATIVMKKWDEFIISIQTATDELSQRGCLDPYFRGHSDSSWKLEPTLAREKSNPRFHNNKEKRLFWEFKMLGSHLLPENSSDWDVLFYMQHHGVPTRLLDWTTSFSIALFFALKEPMNEIAIWMLNPYALNELTMKERSVSNINVSFKMDYREFMNLSRKPVGAIATSGYSNIARMQAQHATFSVHGDLESPLEKLYPKVLQKFTLPRESYNDARAFLKLSNISAFTVFPDLDGLSKFLVHRELGSNE